MIKLIYILMFMMMTASQIFSEELAPDPDRLTIREMKVIWHYTGWLSTLDRFSSDWKSLLESKTIVRLVKTSPHPDSGVTVTPGAYIEAETGKLITPPNAEPRQVFDGKIETLALLSGKDTEDAPGSYHFEVVPRMDSGFRSGSKNNSGDNSKWLVFGQGGFAAYSPLGDQKSHEYYSKLVAMPLDWEGRNLAAFLGDGLSGKWPMRHAQLEFSDAVKAKNYPLISFMLDDFISATPSNERGDILKITQGLDSRLMKSWVLYRATKSFTELSRAENFMKIARQHMEDKETGEEASLCVFYGCLVALHSNKSASWDIAAQLFKAARDLINKNPSWHDRECAAARLIFSKYPVALSVSK